jgi:hypothetical protein
MDNWAYRPATTLDRMALMPDQPQLCELLPEQLREQAFSYRQTAAIVSTPRLADTMIRLAACCERLASSKESEVSRQSL